MPRGRRSIPMATVLRTLPCAVSMRVTVAVLAFSTHTVPGVVVMPIGYGLSAPCRVATAIESVMARVRGSTRTTVAVLEPNAHTAPAPATRPSSARPAGICATAPERASVRVRRCEPLATHTAPLPLASATGSRTLRPGAPLARARIGDPGRRPLIAGIEAQHQPLPPVGHPDTVAVAVGGDGGRRDRERHDTDDPARPAVDHRERRGVHRRHEDLPACRGETGGAAGEGDRRLGAVPPGAERHERVLGEVERHGARNGRIAA